MHGVHGSSEMKNTKVEDQIIFQNTLHFIHLSTKQLGSLISSVCTNALRIYIKQMLKLGGGFDSSS